MAAVRRLWWSTTQGPEGSRIAIDNPGQPPYAAQSNFIDGGDIVYPAPGGGLLRVPPGGGAAEQMFGTIDGQLVYYDLSAGQWVPTDTAPTNTQIPTWDSASGRWVFIDRPTLGAIQYFDTTHNPDGLWNFNGTLNDSSGNGYNMSLAAGGPVAYADVTPGKRGLYMMTGQRFQTASNAPNTIALGDFTGLAILQRDGTTGQQTVFTHAGNGLGVSNGQNANYSLRMDLVATTAARTLSAMSMSGVGVQNVATSTGDASLPPIHNVMFVGVRRSANVIRFYLNGLPFGPDSAVLPAPAAGTDSTTRFIVGAEHTGTVALNQFVLMSLKFVSPLAMTDDQVKAEYNRTMGPAFGVLP